MAGYSGTPLAAKLGIKAGMSLHASGAPGDYATLIEPLPEGVMLVARATRTTDIVHVFATRAAQLGTALERYRRTLGPSATVWVSWPKKSAKVATDITEDTVRALALPLGFVDVKVCAVDDTWSGLKLVVRKALR
ncbi:MAG TPA: DUF3052 domain-containing protein [Gemmatimonadaceae bacterium]|nr:DUF3052 domain-containing protein [Gemmatimonadaceae bacterium]